MKRPKYDFYEIGARKEAERVAEIKEVIENFAREYPIRKLIGKSEGITENTQYKWNSAINHYLRIPEEISPIFIRREFFGHNNSSGAGKWRITAYDFSYLEEGEIKSLIGQMRIGFNELGKTYHKEPFTKFLIEKNRLFEIEAERRADYLSNWARKGPPTSSLPNGGKIQGRDDSRVINHPHHGIMGGPLEWHDAIELVYLLSEGNIEEDLKGGETR